MTRIGSTTRVYRVIVGVLLAGLAVGAFAATASADARFGPAAGSSTGAADSAHSGDGYHAHSSGDGETDVNVCSYATPPGIAHCNARVRTDQFAQQLGAQMSAQGVTPSAVPSSAGLTPTDLQTAYGTTATSATNGAGLTVAIVDAYDNPNAKSDLDLYRSNTGLPPMGNYPCSTGSCFRKVDQNGGTAYPAANAGWAEEMSLDVDMVSAMCPLCNILLVEANNASFANLGTAVNTAATMGSIAISNSYGGGESSGETGYDSSYFNHPGVAITVSSGDSGYGVEYPAASKNVTAVGGTSLKKVAGGGFTETAWSGAGSGCSAYEPKPSWQHDTGCSRRTVADVSAIADPQTGVWVYDTYGGDPGWEIFGGTSVSSPIVASVYALAYAGPSTNQPASYPYANVASLHDVVGGSNGNCGTYLCNAVTGYDGPTGLGTPNTIAALLAVATPPPPPPPANDFSVSATPSSVNAAPGATTTSTITTAVTAGATQPVALTISGAPSGVTGSFSPTSVSAGGSSTLTLTVGNTTSPGTYPLTVTATGTAVHTTTVTLTVATPNFSISVSPTSRTITRGTTTTYTVTITRTNGFTGSVALSVSGQTTRDTATFSPSPIGSGATTSVLTVKTSTLDARGTRTLAIKGTSGSLTHTVNASLVLR